MKLPSKVEKRFLDDAPVAPNSDVVLVQKIGEYSGKASVYSEVIYKSNNIALGNPSPVMTDGLTMPRLARWLAAPKGKGMYAAYVHDALTNPSDKNGSEFPIVFINDSHYNLEWGWSEKSQILYNCLRLCGFSKTRAYIMYASVELYGWWKNYA